MPNLIDTSPAGLIDSLAERVKKILEVSWWYPNEAGDGQHTPAVHAQYLPLRTVTSERDDARDFPLVQVFHDEGEMVENDEASQRIIIAFGGWDLDKTAQGWRIPTAMMWAVLQDLLANPFLEAFQLIRPVKWSLPRLSEDEHPPYFTATITTTWKCPEIVYQNFLSRDENLSLYHDDIIYKNEE